MAKKLGAEHIGSIAAEIIDETKDRIDLDITVPQAEYSKRWRAVQDSMRMKGYDFAYACGSELDRSDIAWLAGVYDPIIERYGVIVPEEGTPVVLSGSEGGHVIEEAVEKSGTEMSILREFQISDEDYRHTRFATLDSVLRDTGFSGTGKLAFLSSPEFIPHQHVLMFERVFGSHNVIFDTELLQHIKYDKSDIELAICQVANTIADAAFRAMLAVSVPGMTELQIAGVGDFVMKELGAGRTGFPTIVTAGRRNYTVIGPATNNMLQEGDMVSMGASPTFNGYHGVVRRTIRVGAPLTSAQMEFQRALEGLYEVVMEAVEAVARDELPSNYIDQQGKTYLEKLRISSLEGKLETPIEPYTFIHNTGCSECQEGFGAVTPYTAHPLGRQVALMIDIALLGFRERDKPVFETLYGVIEDAFWKKEKQVGVYNRIPLNAQSLVCNSEPLDGKINPYHRSFVI